MAELQATMSQEELNLWVAYVQENGPLNLALRIESAVARAVAPFLKNAKPRDLMVWPREPEKEPTLDEMKSGLTLMFKSLATKTKESRNVV